MFTDTKVELQKKLDEYYNACSSVFRTNEIAINGRTVPFRPDGFPNLREFLRAVIAFAAHKPAEPKEN